MIYGKSLHDLPKKILISEKRPYLFNRITAARAKAVGDKSLRKKIYATVLVAVLLLSAPMIVIAATFTRTVELSLIPSTSTVAPGGSVDLTVGAVNPQNFKKGIVGLTMDIYYNSVALEYNADIGISSALNSNDFSVDAHEYEAGKIAVLIYAKAYDTNSESGLLLAVQSSGALFTLPFNVKSGIYEANCVFSAPKGYKLADYNDDASGFTYAAVTPVPNDAYATVTPSYTVSIPCGTVAVGPAGTAVGNISLLQGSILPAAGLRVTASGADSNTLSKTGESIAYELTEDAQGTQAFTGVTFTNGGTNMAKSIYVYISEEAWKTATSGRYKGKVTFTVEPRTVEEES